MKREDVDTPLKAAEFSTSYAKSVLTGNCPLELPWFINAKAVDTAKKLLGITWPVRINVAERLDQNEWSVGFYRCAELKYGKLVYKEDRDHDIGIYSRMSPEFASMAIWHELKHAAQCEGYEAPGEFVQLAYPETTLGYSWKDYANIPVELEAYATAVNHFDLFPLTMKASGR